MNHRLVCLGRENVRGAHSQCIGLGRAFLERGLDRRGRVQLVVVDSKVFGNGRIRGFGLSSNRGKEAFGKHD